MLVVNEDQKMLQEAAKSFAGTRSPVSALRTLRDEKVADGFDRALWEEMATLGWAGVVIDEAHGGLGFGYVGAGLLCEEMARTLAASPLVSSAIMGGTAFSRSGTAAQKARWLPAIAGGKALVALAIDEGRRHDPAATALKAEREGDGYRLTGTKTYVVDGHVADAFLVVARTGSGGGLSVFVVERADATAPGGVRVERLSTLDSRGAARITFEAARVGAAGLLGEVDGGLDVVGAVLGVGRAMYAAELVGIAEEVFGRTLQYLKDRKQFGRSIGSFQALQHRAAHLYGEIEMARSAVLAALQALDAGPTGAAGAADAALAISVAKAKAGTVARLAVQEAIQMHGGIGVTDEVDLGLFAKRMQVVSGLYGDADFHADLVATLRGF